MQWTGFTNTTVVSSIQAGACWRSRTVTVHRILNGMSKLSPCLVASLLFFYRFGVTFPSLRSRTFPCQFLQITQLCLTESVNLCLWISLWSYLRIWRLKCKYKIWYFHSIPTECISCRKQEISYMEDPCLKDCTDSSDITKRVCIRRISFVPDWYLTCRFEVIALGPF